MNRRSRDGLTPAGTFAVFALIRSFRLSWLPERALCPIPQTRALPSLLSPACGFSAPFDMNTRSYRPPRIEDIYLGGLNLTKEMPIARRKSENLSHLSLPFAL